MNIQKRQYTKYKIYPDCLFYKELVRLNELIDDLNADLNFDSSMNAEEKERIIQYKILEKSILGQILQIKLKLYKDTGIEL